jgi:hypothetical protein
MAVILEIEPFLEHIPLTISAWEETNCLLALLLPVNYLTTVLKLAQKFEHNFGEVTGENDWAMQACRGFTFFVCFRSLIFLVSLFYTIYYSVSCKCCTEKQIVELSSKMITEQAKKKQTAVEEVKHDKKKKRHKKKRKDKQKKEDISWPPVTTLPSDLCGTEISFAPDIPKSFFDSAIWPTEDTPASNDSSIPSGICVSDDSWCSPIQRPRSTAVLQRDDFLSGKDNWKNGDEAALPMSLPERGLIFKETKVRSMKYNHSEDNKMEWTQNKKVERQLIGIKSEKSKSKGVSLSNFLEGGNGRKVSNGNSIASLKETWKDYLDSCSVLDRSFASSEQRTSSLRKELSRIRSLMAGTKDRQEDQRVSW